MTDERFAVKIVGEDGPLSILCAVPTREGAEREMNTVLRLPLGFAPGELEVVELVGEPKRLRYDLH
jgi:hypothetical protein